MIYRRFYFTVILYVAAIIICASGIVFFFSRIILYSALFLVLMILATISFIRWLNITNEKLAFFFSAVRNDDTSFQFPENRGLEKEKILNKSLNDLNRKLQDARINIEIQEKFYRSIMDNIRTGIISFSQEGIVEFANPEFLRMFNIEHISHINRLEKVDSKLKEMLMNIRQGEKKWINVRVERNLLSLAAISQEIILQGRVMKIVSLQDIKTELDRQEIDSWQKLIRILNHEIMNSVTPITSLSSTILGFYKTLEGNKTPDMITQKIVEDTIRGLNIIGEHGNGLVKFVDSYRSLVRLPNPEFKEIRLDEFFERVVIFASSDLNADKKESDLKPSITTFVNPPDLTILADDKLLARVLVNLIKNSAESFVENKGNNLIEISGSINSDGKVVITVMDNGKGMDQEVMDKIFIPFFTTKESGSGIGLSLSRQILRLHNGTITCVSVPDKGTTFTLVF
jgi:two-component system, NtrC family, nitrogen regulation sensor histidine kinase NtrY